jgi:2-(1,2-epoxy-1,2-dihydrophenyl)acetyl-CoA isomerase
VAIRIERNGPRAGIVFDKPEKLNALTPEERGELAALFAQLQQDDTVRVVTLQGAGKAFCSGADVSRMGENDLISARRRMQTGVHPLIRNLCALEKPVIAGIRGAASGIGWGMALASDFVIASETAKFSFVFVRRGLIPDAGSLYMLARHVGLFRAKEIVYTGRAVLADEALALGLVSKVVADDQLEAEVSKLADEMAKAPTRAIGFAKQLFDFAHHSSLDPFLSMEALIQPQLNQSEDYREGVASFREKRPPNFVGR